MNILDTIMARRRERIADAKMRIPLSDLRSMARDADTTRDFARCLERQGRDIRLIAEIKKASPSKGIIRNDFDPVAIARVYEEKAVDCISVLTEEDFFQGDLRYLKQVRDVTGRPILRKDFIVDEYQIYESRVAAADAILLIAAGLETAQAEDYLAVAYDLGLAVLFEIHDERDLEKSLAAGSRITGINNRDLTTFAIDLSTTLRLSKEIPDDTLVVSESGITSRADVEALIDAGIDAMLIGTSFMRAQDIGQAIDTLMTRS